jgi:hypothetical protein
LLFQSDNGLFVMAALTEEHRETDAANTPNPKRERQRRWYRSLSPDQLTARRIRQAEQQRIRREKQKAGIYTPRKRMSADERRERLRIYNREWQRQKRTALKATASPLQPVSESTAPMKPANPTTQRKAKPAQALRSQDLVSYDDLSAHRAKALQRVWRKDMSDFLLDAITKKDSPFSGAGLRSSKAIFFWFNLAEKLDRIVEQEKPGQTEEFLLAVMLECLNRLTTGEKTGAPPKIG